MKEAQCAKCGLPVTVPDTFDVFEDMEVCPECEHQMMQSDEGARE